MSDYTSVYLVGPGGRGAELRIYPQLCQVHFAGMVAVGSKTIRSLYVSLQNRSRWDGTSIVTDPSWLMDKVMVRFSTPFVDRPIILAGSRSEMMKALEEVFAANA